jgi:hypothetical protein
VVARHYGARRDVGAGSDPALDQFAIGIGSSAVSRRRDGPLFSSPCSPADHCLVALPIRVSRCLRLNRLWVQNGRETEHDGYRMTQVAGPDPWGCLRSRLPFTPRAKMTGIDRVILDRFKNVTLNLKFLSCRVRVTCMARQNAVGYSPARGGDCSRAHPTCSCAKSSGEDNVLPPSRRLRVRLGRTSPPQLLPCGRGNSSGRSTSEGGILENRQADCDRSRSGTFAHDVGAAGLRTKFEARRGDHEVHYQGPEAVSALGQLRNDEQSHVRLQSLHVCRRLPPIGTNSSQAAGSRDTRCGEGPPVF